MNRREVSWRVVLLLALLLLAAACRPAATPTEAPPEKPTTPPTEVPKAVKPVTLRFAHPTWWRDYPRYKEHYIPEFEKRMAAKGTPVKIELVEYPAPDDPYREKQVLDMAAGQAPDIFMEDTFYIGADVEAGYLLDLTDRVNAWEWDKWVEAAKGAVTYKGRVWALNRDTDVRPLYYRKDIFQQAGIPVPWQPRSWDDILEAARTIKAKVPDVYPIALKSGVLGGEATTMQGFYMVLLGAGGRLYDAETGKWVASSPAIRDALGFYRTLIDEELTMPPDFWLASSPVDKAHELLRDGKLAMFVTWDGVWYDTGPGGKWEIPNRDEALGYAKMPAKAPGAGIRGQDFVTISGGWSMAIYAKTQHPDLAWEFLKFVYSKDEVIGHLTEYPGGLPARKDVAEDPAWKDTVDDYTIWRATELVPLTTFRPPLPAYPKVSEAVQTATENILLGKSPEEAMDAFAKDVTRAVGAENVEEQ